MSSVTAAWSNRHYDLEDGDVIRKNGVALGKEDEGEIYDELARYVESRLLLDYRFSAFSIPPAPADSEESEPSTSVLASADFATNEKLLLIVQNSSGSQMGIFSRSLCLEQGISKGSMLAYVDKAIQEGYAVLILRPNTNSIVTSERAGSAPVKAMIRGSETPEIHSLCVWETVLPLARNVQHIALLAYGNGASLCHDLYLRSQVQGSTLIKAFLTIEASHIVEEDDPEDIKSSLKSMVVNMECSQLHTKGHILEYRRDKLGTVSLSLGLPEGVEELSNVAACIPMALESVFSYFKMSAEPPPTTRGPLSEAFSEAFVAKNLGSVSKEAAIIKMGAGLLESAATIATDGPAARASQTESSMFGRIFGFASKKASVTKSASAEFPGASASEGQLSVADFDLLRIVGKGAFGKVMLVRKKVRSGEEGEIYAMKVLKKSVIAAKGQIEHTKSEKAILCEIRHPFIVRLRFSFQSDDKLYLVTDYYNGGTLFMHLRLSKQFSEDRAKFYSAELLSALQHLHSKGIIYRDLKLENVLMDHLGHIALTDFGLSKQDIDKTGGATTFCGTAEYIAPELLKGQKYGHSVDWWSFGILMYVVIHPLTLVSIISSVPSPLTYFFRIRFEMMYGRTPFYDKNRRLMFYRIMNSEPQFPPQVFSVKAMECITALLKTNVQLRLGSGPSGAVEIMESSFFADIDFEALMRREIAPPYRPEVSSILDTTYVPKSFFKMDPTRDSVSEPLPKGQQLNFPEFSYSGDSVESASKK